MNRKLYDKLIFEYSKEGRKGYKLPQKQFSADLTELPSNLMRQDTAALPQVDEPTVVRHYTNMSTNNFGVDTGFYPLGSCTMKYNPKVNEEVVSDRRFSHLHPAQPPMSVQGALKAYYELQKMLSEIGGMAEFTLNPFAGAHGELTGLMAIHAYHDANGDKKRTKVIVPDSAHGTNPASAAVCGYDVVEVKSLSDGTVDVEDLAAKLDDTVAAIMMTNPNTVGMFEKNIPLIADMAHKKGALMYYDGANLNALLGIARPGDMGFDVMHINLHKTFSTPHGGGGPGAGPVGVRAGLEQFLPNPRVVKSADGNYVVEGFETTFTAFNLRNNEKSDSLSLGRVSGWLGNFAVELRALAYILRMGVEGLSQIGALATLNANYIKASLDNLYCLPIDGHCMHEFVFDGLADKSTGVTTLNVAKRLLDFGFHAPTIYFPLLFHESLMIEPTETESIETLDKFIEAMQTIAREAKENAEFLKAAPHDTPVVHPDDTTAAINPLLTWSQIQNNSKDE